MPLVLFVGGVSHYLLLKDIQEELSEFIHFGKTERSEFRVLSAPQEQALERICHENKLTVKYRTHQLEYMHRRFTIIFPRVRNPETGAEISLIPWFVVPGRPLA